MDSVFVHSFIRFNRGAPFPNQKRNKAFSILLDLAKNHDFAAYLSSYNLYDKRKKQLKKAWMFENNKWKIVKNKKVNLFYYHGKTDGILKECQKIKKRINIPIINHLGLEKICDDKFLTSAIFSEYSPATFLVNNFYNLQKAIHLIKSDKIVLKPRFGSYGRGVAILNKNQLKNGIKKDTILQEFIDSSNGICGIKAVHDLRVIVINGKINHSYIRIPKNGSLICSATLGADKVFIENDEIPCSILKKVRKIDSELKHYGPRVYSADFALDKSKKPWLIELNSKPGMLYYDKAPGLRIKFYNQLYKTFKGLI